MQAMNITTKRAPSKTGVKHVINGKAFSCVLDAIEYRDMLDANYIKVVWKKVK
jgi:hypothetical protein